MADIVRAIEKEEEYLAYRMKNEEPYHLADAIKEFGFDSLEDYFDAKRDYKFNQLTFSYTEKSPSECVDHILHMLNTKETGVIFIDSDETFVFVGENAKYDHEYCDENDIPVYPLRAYHGTVVSTPGDLTIGFCFPEILEATIKPISNKLKSIFSTYMNEVDIEGNDISLNGQKICSSIMYHQNGMMCLVYHFSFNDNSDLIKTIFYSSSNIEIPTFIRGLTSTLFKKVVKLWLRVH